MAQQSSWSAARSHKDPYERVPLPDWPHRELLYETIDNGKIAIMTINRPERMNSSDPRWVSDGLMPGPTLPQTIVAGRPS